MVTSYTVTARGLREQSATELDQVMQHSTSVLQVTPLCKGQTHVALAPQVKFDLRPKFIALVRPRGTHMLPTQASATRIKAFD